MITAKQALEITNNAGNSNYKNQMAEITNAILEDAIKGYNCCAIRPTNHDNFWDIHKYFTERGFDASMVTEHSTCSGTCDYGLALISWKNPRDISDLQED